VLARGNDVAGNQAAQSSLTISNIDKTAPTVTAVNGGVTTSSVTVNATASDAGGSALKASAYEYSKDNGTTWTAATSAATYSFTGLTSGTYQCKVRVTDNAGNATISTAVSISTQGVGNITLSPSTAAWTNANVTVTITYPAELTTKEYSTNGGSTWAAYTAPVTMTANGTILARGNDVAGNQAAQSSLTISNIDKTTPMGNITPSTTAQTNQNVTLTFDAGDSIYYYNSSSTIATARDTFPTAGFSVIGGGSQFPSGNNYVGARFYVSGKVKVNSYVDGNVTTCAGFSYTTTAAAPTWVTGTGLQFTMNSIGSGYKEFSGIYQISSNYFSGLKPWIQINVPHGTPGYNIEYVDLKYAIIPSTFPSISSGIKEITNPDNTKTTQSQSTYIATQNGDYNFTATDNAGNSTVYTYSVTNIDKVAPSNPTIVASPTGWTNGDVTATITYPVDMSTKEYSINGGSTWSSYTAPVTMTANGTVLARGNDAAGNQSGQSSLTITNIDKTAPTVTAVSGGVTTSSVTVNATASDAGGSGLKANAYEYSKDNGATWTTATNATTYNFTGLTSGTYQCKVRVTDNAGNSTISTAVAISTQGVGNITLSPSTAAWTNGNVIVTITYPAELTTKQYSIDGGSTWNNYTAAITMTANGSVLARGNDVAGNQATQSSLTISNIDKTAPTVTAGSTGTESTSSLTVIVQTSGDTGGSGLKTNAYEYSKDNGVTWTAATNAVGYTFSGLTSGTAYQCKIRVTDNAGNITVSSTVPITTKTVGNITLSPSTTSWTNANVTVTITYPAELTTKEYKIGAGAWTSYTGVIAITTNDTILARGSDIAGNQATQSSLTLTNIDKILPNVVYGTNGATNVTSANTTVTVTDSGGSGINTLQYVWSNQNSISPSSGWNTFTSGNALTYYTIGTYYLWIKATDTAGNITTTASNAFSIVDGETIVSTVSSYHKTFSGATSGYTYNNPVIPAGFVAVNTSDAKWSNLSTDWDKGLVIEDTSGNQFVWVPVDGTNVQYAKWCTAGITYTATIDDTLPSGFSANNITTTYKGFYIARYEAGFDYNGGSIRATSKKNTNKTTLNWSSTRNATYSGYLWNFINYTDAKLYSENMANSYGYNTSLVGTNLITGAEWDTVMKWIQNSGRSVTDSRTWGNHSNSISPANISGYGSLQVSGYSNNWKEKNIFDIAGNAWEWVNEKYSSYFIESGGGCINDGAGYSASYRGVNFGSNFDSYLSFRVALYINPYQQSSAAGTEASPGTPLTVHSTINGQLPTYNNPVIPAGFRPVNTAVANWNNVSTDWDKGLVIQDPNGNQFVWVPVDGTNVPYAKWCNTLISYTSTADDTMPGDFNVNNITNTYKGFYIARYESVFDYNGGNIRPASKKSTNITTTNWSSTRNSTYNGYLWNYINYSDAKTYSENMASRCGYNTTLLGTNLATGSQWDTVMKWIANSGINVTFGQGWGNYYYDTFTYDYPTTGTKGYYEARLLNTGATSRNSAKNIYDLGGNLCEWTSEKYSSSFIVRGGSYISQGNSSGGTASTRESGSASFSADYNGFRIALYLK
ncbi:MAG: formylglycine-generating enzyme family protein, partial [Clostridia bacterium]|nr:formylglycine-generating enzyme family protein [Clostridia bacterium]